MQPSTCRMAVGERFALSCNITAIVNDLSQPMVARLDPRLLFDLHGITDADGIARRKKQRRNTIARDVQDFS